MTPVQQARVRRERDAKSWSYVTESITAAHNQPLADLGSPSELTPPDTAEAPRVPVDLCTPPEKETDRTTAKGKGKKLF